MPQNEPSNPVDDIKPLIEKRLKEAQHLLDTIDTRLKGILPKPDIDISRDRLTKSVQRWQRALVYFESVTSEDTGERMKIYVNDWMRGRLLDNAPYKDNHTTEGTEADAMLIASELFALGLNVKVTHEGGVNKGTKKNPEVTPKQIRIWVDDRNFQQR